MLKKIVEMVKSRFSKNEAKKSVTESLSDNGNAKAANFSDVVDTPEGAWIRQNTTSP